MASRLNKAKAQFESRLDEAEDFVDRCTGARHASTTRPALTRDFTEWSHEIALLKVVIASERFYKTTLALYVLGMRTESGWRPRRNRQLRATLAEVLETFRGDQDFIGWTDTEVVLRRAERWLRDGEPFQTALSGASQVLGYVRKMRNAIAHESDSANDKYAKATRGLYGARPARLSPGAQLLGPPPPGIPYLTGPTLISATVQTYRAIARALVP